MKIKIQYLMPILSTLTNIFMGAAVIITIISGVDYFVKNKDTIRVDK